MEHSNSILICPVCQHKNKADAQRCAQCGVSLLPNTTTMRVSDESIERAVGVRPVSREMVGEGVVFYIAGEVQPLIVRGRSEIILGRKVEGQPAEVVDMTPYHGHLLGVSRRHARLVVSPEGALIEDLGSTNGTWLNEKRLTPDASFVVTSGDQIRLGQLILFVYFSSGSTRQKITLKPSLAALAVIEPPPYMTIHLARQAAAYLEALIGIQGVIDLVQARPQTRVVINSMAVHSEPAGVEVAVEGLVDAVKLVEEVIVPWQKQHASLLAGLWAGGRAPAPPAQPPAAGPLPEAGGPLTAISDDVSKVLDTARFGGKPAEASPAPPESGSGGDVLPARETVEIVPEPGVASAAPGTATLKPEIMPSVEKSPAEEPQATPESQAASEPQAAADTIDSRRQAREEAVQALLAEMLSSIKTGLLGVEQDNADYCQQLRPYVDTLLLSTLEVVKSSF